MSRFLYYWKKYSFLFLFIFLPLVALVDSRFGLLAIICVFAPIITSFFAGRFWCGNLCPRGSLYDGFVKKISGNKKTPRFFKTIYFRIFVVMLTIFYFYYNINLYGLDLYQLGLTFCKFFVITTLLAILLATFYNERTWCTFCPVGTLSALNSKIFNRINKGRLLKVNSNCLSCKACVKTCPMSINIYEYKDNIITDKDCILCKQCINTCKYDAIKK